MSTPTLDQQPAAASQGPAATKSALAAGRGRATVRRPGASRRSRIRYALSTTSHLVSREFRVRYRRAVLGWLWSVAQPLLRFFVLLYVFTHLIVIGTPQYPQFLFTGLVFWGFFAVAVASATSSPLQRRDLLFRPGLPRWTVPLTSVAIDAIDLLAALPVLVVILLLGNGIPATAPWIVPILLVQLLLILGIGMLAAVANVYVHDTRIAIDVVLSLGFYLTPVIYRLDSLQPTHRRLVELNPMTPLLEAQRRVLIEGHAPEWLPFLRISAIAVGIFVVGLAVYERASRTFVDQL